MSDYKRKIIDIVFNSAIFILVAVFWVYMMFFAPPDTLSTRGIQTLRYFTVLSNLSGGILSAITVVFDIASLKNGKKLPGALYYLKYASTGMLFVTFIVASFFLTPIYGWFVLFRGANLPFHIIVPILAIIDFSVFERDYPVKVRHAALCVLPALVYGICYLINLLVNGISWDTDFYGFAAYGYGIGSVIFIFILALNFGLNCAVMGFGKIKRNK